MGKERTVLVITVGIGRIEYPKAITDGDTRRYDQKPSGETLTLRVTNCVDSLPGDDHCHDSGLAGTG